MVKITVKDGVVQEVQAPKGVVVEIEDLDYQDGRKSITRWKDGECIYHEFVEAEED